MEARTIPSLFQRVTIHPLTTLKNTRITRRFKSINLHFSIFIRILIGLSMITLAFSSCVSRKEIIYGKMKNHQIRTINYWQKEWKDKTVIERIKPAPPELIEYLHLDNEKQGFSERPIPFEPIRELIEAMEGIELDLPIQIKNLLEENLIGIFSVKDLGGSGYMESVRDTQGKERYGIIVLDVNVLKQRKANEWATWRENSFIKPMTESNVKVRMVIESEENNTVTNTFRFILLHELGHLLGNVTRVHPPWYKWEKIEDYPFIQLSWKQSKNKKIISKFDDKFPERKSIRFYSFEKARLNSNEIINAYNNFHYTNYISMYAATNILDDFTESFTCYFHNVINKRPLQVIIKRKDQPEIVIKSGWDEERCKTKKEYMRRWFENPLMANTR